MKDLLPVRHTMRAANRAAIEIDGAILLRISGESSNGTTYEAAAMVYISPSTNAFFLSKDVMVQLGVISPSFPEIGTYRHAMPGSINASELQVEEHKAKSANSNTSIAPCGCR